MSRSAAELKQAAIDAGWGSDPLALEILEKLTDNPAPPLTALPASKAKAPGWIAIVAFFTGACAAALVTGHLERQKGQRELDALRSEQRNALAQKDQELAWLKQSHSQELKTITANLEQTLRSADAVAKSSGTAASMSNDLVKLLFAELQRAQQQAQRTTSPTEPDPKADK
jgi:hypothetical protein